MLIKLIFSLAELSVYMSLLILSLLLFIRLFGNNFSARCRYVLWTLIILRLCIPFHPTFLPAVWEIPLPASLTLTTAVFPAENNPVQEMQNDMDISDIVPFEQTEQSLGIDNSPTETEKYTYAIPVFLQGDKVPIVLTGIWLCTAGLLFFIRIAGYLSFSRRLSRTWRLPMDKQAEAYHRLGSIMRIPAKKLPALYITGKINSPMLCGFCKPVVLLPDIVLTENQLAGILAHELTHFRRKDLWVRLACAAAVSLHWFNPLVYMAANRCSREMELSCDEQVLAGKDTPVRTTYGRVMLDIIRRCSLPKSALTTHFNPQNSAVMERFACILDSSIKKQGTAAILLMGIACAAAGSIITFSEAEHPFITQSDFIYTETQYPLNGEQIVGMIPGEVYESFGGTQYEFVPQSCEYLDMSLLKKGEFPLTLSSMASPETLYSRYQLSFVSEHTKIFAAAGALIRGNDPSFAYVYSESANGEWYITALPAPDGTICKGVVLRGIPVETGYKWLLGLLADDGSVRFFRSKDGSTWIGGSAALHPDNGKSWLVQYSRHSGVGGETLCLVFDGPTYETEQFWLSYDWGNTFVRYDLPIMEALPETCTDLKYLGKAGGSEKGEFSLYFLTKDKTGNRHIRFLSAHGTLEGSVANYTYNAAPLVRNMISEYRYGSPDDNGGIFWLP